MLYAFRHEWKGKRVFRCRIGFFCKKEFRKKQEREHGVREELLGGRE